MEIQGRNSAGPVVLTGAAGRVGSRLLPLLRDRHEVWPSDVVEIPGDPQFRRVDILDRADVLRGLRGAGALVHCAIASYGTNEPEVRSAEEVERYHERMLEVNIRGVYHIFEAARALGIPRVVYMSSLTVAMGDDEEGFRTQRIPRPTNVYACTKLFGEHVAEVYHREHGIEAIVLRLGQPFPLGIGKEREWMRCPRASSLFVTLPDIARAVEAALSADVAFGIYNVVSLNDRPIVDLSANHEIGFQPLDHWRSTIPFAPGELAVELPGETSSRLAPQI